jgi:hypothetical protein
MNFERDQWIELDPENAETWPENEQLVEYIFTATGSNSIWKGTFLLSEQEWGKHGTFCSEGGFCDWYDAKFWRPRK